MKSINNNAPVKCSKAISINASTEKVWNTLTNINRWTGWQTDISKPILLGELKPDTHFDWKSGGVTIHSTIHTVDPYSNFGWTGKTHGVFAIHNWTLSKVNGQTQVFVNESMEGLLVSLFKKMFSKNLDKSLQNWLELLKKRV